MAILRLFWLGPPAVEIDAQPLRLEMRKTLALLAYLSLSPQKLTRETLASLFWTDSDQQHALSSLRRNLFSLTRSLPSGLLEIEREKIGLRKAEWLQLDVEEFREQLAYANLHSGTTYPGYPSGISALENAISIYRGDFLEGFTLKDCPEFDAWQFYQCETLRSEYASALEKAAAYYQARREWEKAVAHARLWVARDGLNETAQRMLIGLYHQSGQPGMALRQYEILTTLLQSELGQSPEGATLSLIQSLMSMEIPSNVESLPALAYSTSQGSEPLIKTKLFIPPLRADRVARPRLLELLDTGAQRSLTLVSAPAGFGKTTLLASWAVHTELPVAWFTIDEGDNDPIRFIAYLIEALESVLAPEVSEPFQSFTQPLQPSIQPILIQLINHLAAEREPFVLILDDYQFIHSLEVHQALQFLIEKIPPCLHLVIATRTDPPLSLARLRARDQLVEIRLSNLRFSLEETTIFLKQGMSLQLSNEDVSTLETRTEGWIAGLQMAALAIRTIVSQPTREVQAQFGGQFVSRFIQAFSGSNRYILDYLGEEVLNGRSQEIRSFLLKTSILERFSSPLCDAVIEMEGSQEILEALEKENLFLVPLDSERRWYRYHHLFAELLRFRLKEILIKAMDPDRNGWPGLEELHLRAANWLEKNTHFSEAVHHFIAARKYNQAAILIEAQAHAMIFSTGQIFTLWEWFAELPEDLFRSRPRLNIARAWILITKSQFDAALEPLEIAWQAVKGRQDPEAGRLSGEIALVRGVLAELSTRDVEAMHAHGLMAWELLPRDDAMLRGLAAWLLGASYLFDGDTRSAENYLSQAVQLCQNAGNVFFTSVAILDLSNVRVVQGKYREAYRVLFQALKEMSSGGRRSHPSLGYLYYGISQILLAWNELEEADHQLKLGLDLVAQDIPGEVLIMGTSILPYLKLAQGKREEALQLAETCLQRVEAYPLPYIPSMIKANLIRFWIRTGERDRIEAWLCSCGLSPDDSIRYVNYVEYTALAKALLWQERTEEALKVLAQLHHLAQSKDRNGKLFYILALEALALNQFNDSERALKFLEDSLRLAQSEGYIRSYVEEGQPMEILLQQGAAQGIWRQAHLEDYVNQLLKAIKQDRSRLEGYEEERFIN